jgi:hypothetical protein
MAPGIRVFSNASRGSVLIMGKPGSLDFKSWSSVVVMFFMAASIEFENVSVLVFKRNAHSMPE